MGSQSPPERLGGGIYRIYCLCEIGNGINLMNKCVCTHVRIYSKTSESRPLKGLKESGQHTEVVNICSNCTNMYTGLILLYSFLLGNVIQKCIVKTQEKHSYNTVS